MDYSPRETARGINARRAMPRIINIREGINHRSCPRGKKLSANIFSPV